MTPIEQLLPALYRQTPEDTELQRVLTLMLERAERDKDFTLEQLFPSTTSGWGLELWERAYGLTVDYTMDEARRRSRILAKVKGVGVTTMNKLRGIAALFSESAVEIVELFAQYRFEIWYTETIGPIDHPEDLAAIVNELKPAHLEWEVMYRQEQESAVFIGCYPRQGDQSIVWKVDCR